MKYSSLNLNSDNEVLDELIKIAQDNQFKVIKPGNKNNPKDMKDLYDVGITDDKTGKELIESAHPEKTDILKILSNLNAVEGRFDYVKSTNNVFAIVDYAHTPDALKNVIDTINSIKSGKEQLITVVGCGGDRDAKKRPIMAKIAFNGSAKVILTSDNPRSEDPAEIIEQMKSGLELEQIKKVLSIENRKEAIKTACSLANSGDVILVAGKGHEKYQEINGVKHPFDDKQVLIDLLT